MNQDVQFKNFEPDLYIKEFILNTYAANKKGYVVDLTGQFMGREIQSCWTGLSLHYCTEKIFADFFTKLMVEKSTMDAPKFSDKKITDSFGFPRLTY